jgi:hypothetical protein
VSIFIKNINLFFLKKKKKITGRQGVAAGGVRPPLAASGGGPATPLPPFSFFCFLNFNFNFLKNISIFIYFLINLYYFIKMDMSTPRVANKMATRGADVAFDEIC